MGCVTFPDSVTIPGKHCIHKFENTTKSRVSPQACRSATSPHLAANLGVSRTLSVSSGRGECDRRILHRAGGPRPPRHCARVVHERDAALLRGRGGTSEWTNQSHDSSQDLSNLMTRLFTRSGRSASPRSTSPPTPHSVGPSAASPATSSSSVTPSRASSSRPPRGRCSSIATRRVLSQR